MRNLTLGLMIVAGGTLAALPFRRTAPVDPRSIESAPIDPVSVSNPSYPSPVGMLVDHSEPQAEWLDRLAPKQTESTPQWPAPRELSTTLTYEQLAVPISRPEQIERRFTATEEVRQAGKKNKKVAITPPAVAPRSKQANRSLVVSSSPQPTESILVNEPSEKTSLASTPMGASQIEPLPKRNASTRERFWIRQP